MNTSPDGSTRVRWPKAVQHVLDLAEITRPRWLDPHPDESVAEYAARLSSQPARRRRVP